MPSPHTLTGPEVATHTPTPWKVDPRHCDDILGADGRDVAETYLGSQYVRPADERRANAELIVSRVNSHDGLVAALKWISDLDEAVVAQLDVASVRNLLKMNAAKARAALKKAGAL